LKGGLSNGFLLQYVKNLSIFQCPKGNEALEKCIDGKKERFIQMARKEGEDRFVWQKKQLITNR